MSLNKKLKIVFIFLLLIEISTIFLMAKTLLNSNNIETNKLESNNLFAIMLGDNEIYTESTSDKWPDSLIYIYNENRSGCMDEDGNILNDVLNYDASKQVVNVVTSKALGCYLYFDLEKIPPENFTFSLKGYPDTLSDYTNKKEVEGTLTWDEIDVREYCLINENRSTNCTWNNTTGNSMKVKYTFGVDTTDGIKYIYAYLKDAAGNVSIKEVKDSIILDTLAPEITINPTGTLGNNGWYKELTISANVVDVSSIVAMVNYCTTTNPSCTPDKSVTGSVILPTNSNTQKVCYQASDILNNTTEIICSNGYKVDGEAPTSNSVVINNSATYTTSTSVTLTLSSSGAAEMCISNTETCTNWESYNTSKTHTLSTGDGNKTIYVWYRDLAGNTTNYVSDNIILDTVNPSVTNAKDANGGKLSFTASDTTSGVLEYCINTNASSTTGCTWYSAVSGTNTSGAIVTTTNTYYVHLKDKAGNIGHSSGFKVTVIAVGTNYTLTTSGTWTAPVTGSYSITVVGGGGGGGSGSAMESYGYDITLPDGSSANLYGMASGGGGGSSGVVTTVTQTLIAATSYSYSIGSGGLGAEAGDYYYNGGNPYIQGNDGGTGGTSTFNGISTVTAKGGGGGEYGDDNFYYYTAVGGRGGTGGYTPGEDGTSRGDISGGYHLWGAGGAGGTIPETVVAGTYGDGGTGGAGERDPNNADISYVGSDGKAGVIIIEYLGS